MNNRHRGSRSTFMRRFARHSNLATVFRAAPALPEHAARIQASPSPGGAPSPQAVQATIVPEGTDLPAGHVLGYPPAPTPPLAQREPSPAAPPPGRAQPPIQRSTQAKVTPPAATDASVTPAARQDISPAEEEPSFGDRAWGRLQNIFNRHQQKQAEEDNIPQEAVQEAPPVQRKTGQGPDPASQVVEGAASDTPDPLERQEPAALAEQSPPDTPPEQEEPQIITPGEADVPQHTDTGSEEMAATPSVPPEIDPPIETPEAPGAPTRISQPEDVGEPTQSLPLEAVWPVQRMQEPVRAPSHPAQPPIDETTGLTPSAVSPLSEEEESKVQQTLESVQSGQPTSSTIEVIPPRRPRPEIQAKRPGPPKSPPEPEPATPKLEISELEEPEIIATGEVQEDRPPTKTGLPLEGLEERQPAAPPTQVSLREEPVQPIEPVSEPVQVSDQGTPREIPTEAAPERPPMDGPETVISRKPAAPAEAVTQRQPESGPAARPDRTSDPSRVVPTEVGPLPADLWTLIGETPPPPTRPEGQVPTTTEAAQPSSPIPVPVEESPAIQRRVTETQSTTEAQASSNGESRSSTEESSTEESSEPEIDMDELSHKVYAEIRRRLTSEWERIRGRF